MENWLCTLGSAAWHDVFATTGCAHSGHALATIEMIDRARQQMCACKVSYMPLTVAIHVCRSMQSTHSSNQRRAGTLSRRALLLWSSASARCTNCPKDSG